MLEFHWLLTIGCWLLLAVAFRRAGESVIGVELEFNGMGADARDPRETDAPEEDLLRDGWVRRFVADEPRLSESSDLYESLGFEVRWRPLSAREPAGPGCSECLKAAPGRFRVIFTKPRRAMGPDPCDKPANPDPSSFR